jgi:tight adherence protein C
MVISKGDTIMITLLIPILLITAILALGVTHLLALKARELKIKQFLDKKNAINFNWVHEFVGSFGQDQQRELKNKFAEAGIYNSALARYFAPIKYASLLLIIIGVLLSGAPLASIMSYLSLSVVAVLIAPDMFLVHRKKRLIEKNSRQLPYMLDMMSVCVQTGMTLEATFRYLSDELQSFDKDLCYQIRKTSDGAAVKGMELALADLAERVPTSEVRSFALTLTQNIQYGTSISSVLTDLAEDLRREQILVMEEKIGKLSAKMSVPLILLVMFPIVILILAPGIVRMVAEMG